MIKLPLRAIAGLLIVILCAACETESQPETDRPVGGTAAGVSAAPEGEPADTGTEDAASPPGPAPADTAWTVGVVEVNRDLRGVAVLLDVRVAAHEDFDRIVLDFGDVKAPGYPIEDVDRPVRACGSGEVVALPGDAWLMIETRPAAAHDEQGYATVRNRDMAVDLPVIERFRSICDFEAVVAWVAAVRSPNPYRVIELDSPTRLIVDIRH